ncbi:alpha-1,4-glucan--maltose-1-phosphate maltosyltransferase [Corynebacterium sp. TAE3-ERU12]|uniref:alpha-1,4-glucan--maltose-1-phosphate maltosyltransferase n=1 Tax=Corynebacterium sp. TAE3-ERU12 TaxID=2849491 RepID=UPI001C44B2BC|nr:alpha-1,4-glucan--maltose-1-phosphate maltosyltransferase [Corynebacterium sp. TAE3-ERU12]
MTGRLGIDDVRPVVDGGVTPAKAVVGEVVPVFAVVWREGHDKLNATLNVKGPGESSFAARTQRIPMRFSDHDPNQVNATFVPDAPGLWTFRVDAWSDPMATWRNSVTKKIEAGQSAAELANDMAIGAGLFDRAAANSATQYRPHLRGVASLLRDESADVRARVAAALSDETRHILELHPLRELLTRGKTRKVLVDRRAALVGAWYEFFPRSTGGVDDAGNPVHGTFASSVGQLDRAKRMGFDVVYLPPIHPVGEINRKGRNNTLTPEPEDVGSPWAIGSELGGHDALHPELGDADDFKKFIAEAEDRGLEVAIDLALQCAPDHPWAKEHPEWFTVLPDGTIAYAENPPKKYQDIYPLNFDNDPKGIYNEILRVVMLWVKRGVRTFRVDNPHTKPGNFWEWLISTVHETHPEVIFLAEAFTAPARLYGLAKAGFQQSYIYFPWKTTKKELTEFGEEIVRHSDIARPSLWVNTPDILHEFLVSGGRAAFAIRASIAATMSPLWGMYSGFELYENVPVKPGSEEYLDSEKYQLRHRDYDAALESGNSLEPYITTLNTLRHEHPALQQLRTLRFHEVDNDNLLAYSKFDPLTGDTVLVVVNLDPWNAQEGTLTIGMNALGHRTVDRFDVTDLVTGETFNWGQHNYVRLEPWRNVAHIIQLPDVPEHMRRELAWREVPDYEG